MKITTTKLKSMKTLLQVVHIGRFYKSNTRITIIQLAVTLINLKVHAHCRDPPNGRRGRFIATVVPSLFQVMFPLYPRREISENISIFTAPIVME